MTDYRNPFTERDRLKTQLLIDYGDDSGKMARACTVSNDYVIVPVRKVGEDWKPLHKTEPAHARFVYENVTPGEFALS